MSKLQDLIKRLCPNGVPFKPLGELGEFTRGAGIQKSDFREDGIGCIHYGQIYTHYGTFATQTKSFISETLAKKLRKAKKGNIIIATTSENIEDVGKAVAWLGEEDIAVSTDAFIFSHHLNPKFVSYFFQTADFQHQKRPYVTGTKVMRISGSDLAKILIPVPPLEVQEEIVKILDSFSDYAAELQAELQARKEQYEYYRNLLLTFNPSACGFGTDGEQEDNVTTWGGHSYKIRYSKLGELGNFYGGLTGKTKDDFNKGNAKFITYMNVFSNLAINQFEDASVKIRDNEKQNTLRYGDIIFTGSSETPEECGMTSVVNMSPVEPLYLNSFCFGFRFIQNTTYYPDFAKHLFSSQTIRNQIIKCSNGVTRFNLSKTQLAKIIIPIPSMELQIKIANILDRFETLVNDLSQGLPAEIEAVREQYEYYRNRLLTFKQLA